MSFQKQKLRHKINVPDAKVEDWYFANWNDCICMVTCLFSVNVFLEHFRSYVTLEDGVVQEVCRLHMCNE